MNRRGLLKGLGAVVAAVPMLHPVVRAVAPASVYEEIVEDIASVQPMDSGAFIPEMWSKSIIEEYKRDLIFSQYMDESGRALARKVDAEIMSIKKPPLM